MMKKTKMVSFLILTAILLSGCGKNTNSSAISENSSATQESISQNVKSLSNEEIIPVQITETEPEILQMNGIEMQIPEGFQDENKYGYCLYGKQIENEKIYLDYLFYDTYSEPEKQEIQLNGLSDFFSTLLLYCVKNCYDTTSGEFLMIPDTQEEIIMLDCPAMVETGHMHVNDEISDLYYKIYYTMMPLKLYDGVKFPSCWISFGEDTEEARVEIDSALKIFAEQAKEN